MERTKIQKRPSLNYFDPDERTRSPPKPTKSTSPKVKRRTSPLEIAQRVSALSESIAGSGKSLPDFRRGRLQSAGRGSKVRWVSQNAGNTNEESKRRTSLLEIAGKRVSVSSQGPDGPRQSLSEVKTIRRGSKVKWLCAGFADTSFHNPESEQQATTTGSEPEIALTSKDLGYLSLLHKKSLERKVGELSDIDSPATTRRNFNQYLGKSPEIDSLRDNDTNIDLLNNPSHADHRSSVTLNTIDGSQPSAVKPSPLFDQPLPKLPSPNVIVFKKRPSSAHSRVSLKTVIKQRDKDNSSALSRGTSKQSIDQQGPTQKAGLPTPSTQHITEPSKPLVSSSRLIPNRTLSNASIRSSVRFSVVEDARMDLAGKLQVPQRKNTDRRMSMFSYTSADYVEGNSERERDLEALREQLQKAIANPPLPPDISPDSDYNSHSSNQRSSSSSGSSTSGSESSSSSSSTGSSSGESSRRSSKLRYSRKSRSRSRKSRSRSRKSRSRSKKSGSRRTSRSRGRSKSRSQKSRRRSRQSHIRSSSSSPSDSDSESDTDRRDGKDKFSGNQNSGKLSRDGDGGIYDGAHLLSNSKDVKGRNSKQSSICVIL